MEPDMRGIKMKIEFTKMHGCGNDYVYIDSVKNPVRVADKAELARLVSDRHFGIGSDGLIFVNSSKIANFEMEMYNADGSRSEMCGNGIRCVAKLVYDKGYTDGETFTIESMGKIKYIKIYGKDGVAESVKVDMGEPILEPIRIPVNVEGDRAIAVPIEVDGDKYEMTCVSMGNPHAVVFLDETKAKPSKVTSLEIDKIGPKFENHKVFPNRVNTEFVNVIDRTQVEMRVWERGTGETLACGTGCCATTVACILNGKTDREITINVLGGKIRVKWDESDNHIYMTGPATKVFDGVIEI